MKYTLSAILIIFSLSAYSDITSKEKIEIEYLLNFIKNSPCKITRNGTTYEGVDAVSHIKRKYKYFKEEINTTEQFILLSATKSTMSGKFYMVQCGETKPQKTKEWLLKELKAYRENKNT